MNKKAISKGAGILIIILLLIALIFLDISLFKSNPKITINQTVCENKTVNIHSFEVWTNVSNFSYICSGNTTHFYTGDKKYIEDNKDLCDKIEIINRTWSYVSVYGDVGERKQVCTPKKVTSMDITKRMGNCYISYTIPQEDVTIKWLEENCQCVKWNNGCDPLEKDKGCMLNSILEYCSQYKCPGNYTVGIKK